MSHPSHHPPATGSQDHPYGKVCSLAFYNRNRFSTFQQDLKDKVVFVYDPGQVLPRAVGNGAFTNVWQGTYSEVEDATPIPVAVKDYRMAAKDTPERVQKITKRLICESKIWEGLCHPNIQPYLGYCSNLCKHFALVSPLRHNDSVMTYLKENPTANRLQLVEGVAKGLKYLHSKKVVHADLHPRNILVDDNGEAQLMDFGRARVIGDEFYNSSLLAGCAAYMAPELSPRVEEEDEDVDMHAIFTEASDVYAFAMNFFQIVTNEIPFRRLQPYQIIAAVQRGRRPKCTNCISPDMWLILEDCWRGKPEGRILIKEVVDRIGKVMRPAILPAF